MKIKVVLFIIQFFFSLMIFAQDLQSLRDSATICGLLDKYCIEYDFDEQKKAVLDLNKKELKKIARTLIFSVFSRCRLFSQRPFIVGEFRSLWYLRGRLKSGVRGGVVILIVDRYNSEVILFTHER